MRYICYMSREAIWPQRPDETCICCHMYIVFVSIYSFSLQALPDYDSNNSWLTAIYLCIVDGRSTFYYYFNELVLCLTVHFLPSKRLNVIPRRIIFEDVADVGADYKRESNDRQTVSTRTGSICCFILDTICFSIL